MPSTRILHAGAAVLRAPAAPVARDYIITREFRNLVKTMVEAMRAAPGVGLAAPQIGVNQQVIVLEDTEERMAKLTPGERALRGREPFPLKVIVNPTVTARGNGRATFFEGCLSVPGYMALVERDLEVEVNGFDEWGNTLNWRVRGWPARILQHEVDHLSGTLYVDRMISRTFCANAEVEKHWIHKPVAEVLEGLGVKMAPSMRPPPSSRSPLLPKKR